MYVNINHSLITHTKKNLGGFPDSFNFRYDLLDTATVAYTVATTTGDNDTESGPANASNVTRRQQTVRTSSNEDG